MSELQTSFGVGVGVGELEVEVEDLVELVLLREELEEVLKCVEEWEEDDEDEDFVLEVEVRVDEEDETGDSETQRIWPIERSQFASRVGFQAYS